eukprot:11417581-Heterocapsa_arctica.AAC.1
MELDDIVKVSDKATAPVSSTIAETDPPGVGRTLGTDMDKDEEVFPSTSSSSKNQYKMSEKGLPLQDGVSAIVYVAWDTENSVLEIFSGCEDFIKQARNKNLEVLTPANLAQGWDLGNPLHVKEFKTLTHHRKPMLVTFATSCIPWHPDWNVKEKTKTDAPLRDLCLWDVYERIAVEQGRNGRYWLIENPLSSSAWRLKSIQ